MPTFEEPPYHSDLKPRAERKPSWSQMPPRQPVQEDTLIRSDVVIERKEFSMLFKENPRGRFLRIVEYNGDRSASIIVPSTGLSEFHKLVCEMIEAERTFPKKATRLNPWRRF